MRPDKRRDDEMRNIVITRGFIKHAEGSVLIECGDTRVICTASIEDGVPPFLKNMNKGWLTAEYSMLPRSTHTRSAREIKSGRIGGRTHEIQRLIGRSLRSVMNLDVIGEKTVLIDCDVIGADGGTRTASITGAYVALVDAMRYAVRNGMIPTYPVTNYLAAISVGIVDGSERLDLCYEEDVRADVDVNIVANGSNELVEIQGTAEGLPFSRERLDRLLDLGYAGIKDLIELQKGALSE